MPDLPDIRPYEYLFTGRIDTAILPETERTIQMLRLDLLHPVVSGNKWFKLKYNLRQAALEEKQVILTFGGAYSNHLIATAAAAQASGLKSIGIVRGLHAEATMTPTLQACQEYGMQLQFVSREAYRFLKTGEGMASVQEQYPHAFIVPEGGNNEQGLRGAMEIATYIPDTITHVAVSVGSGCTFSGIRKALNPSVKLLGFVPMKQGRYLANDWQLEQGNYALIDDYHLGGFGKCTDELIAFMNQFYQINNIPLDRVYTAKMMLGMQHLIRLNHFPEEATILAIHTGGTQGNSSIEDKLMQ